MESGNPVLDKNIMCIGSYNPTLAKALFDLPFLTNDIQLIETESQEPNLSYNGLALHSQRGAEDEAKEIFARSENTPLNINVVFGIGIGHLFNEFCKNSLGTIILYEPNLEILRVTLELVDFSEVLSQKNVKVVSNIQELELFFQLVWKYKSKIDIISLDSYQKLHAEEFNNVFKKLEALSVNKMLDMNMVEQRGLDFLLTVLSNLPYSLEAPPLVELGNIYKDKTALIVSAGPTLDLNLEAIKKNRDKVVIFCVGPALKALLKNGIIPDFLNIEEIADVSGQVRGLELSDINLILAPYTHQAVQKLKTKQKFLFPASTTRGGRYWSRLTGLDVSQYTTKGTVSYQALSAAKMLGFKKLILVGQDLAYVNNSCYSQDSAYSDLIFEINAKTGKPEFLIKDYRSYAKRVIKQGEDITDIDCEKIADEKIKELNKRLCLVKGISGEMLPTQIDYAAFINLFVEFANKNPDLELINTSMLGVQIDGFKNIELEKALENEISIEKIKLLTEFKYDKKVVLENLKKEKEYFEEILKYFDKAKEYLHKINRELQRNKNITKDFYDNYNLLSKIYNYASDEYSNKNEFYQMIVAKESKELEYYLTTTKDVGAEKYINTCALLSLYFQNSDKIIQIINEIKKQIELIVENIK